MAFAGKAYRNVVTAKYQKKEVDDASSGFLETFGKTRTAVSDVGSSNTSIFTRKSRYMDKTIDSETFENETNAYTGTEICIGCLQKRNIRKQATHFCKNCDTRGRYISHSCMVDHDLWVGEGHEIVSLSVAKERDSDWQRRDIQRDENEYPYIDSWFQHSSASDDCQYGELNEQDMMNTVGATRSENESDYPWANSDLDEMQRHRMPLPDAYPELQHSEKHIYENIMPVERATKNLRINKPNDSLEQVSESGGKTVKRETWSEGINQLDDNWMLTSKRSPLVDGSSWSFDSKETDYDLDMFYNNTHNQVRNNPLRKNFKDTFCMIM